MQKKFRCNIKIYMLFLGNKPNTHRDRTFKIKTT